MAITASGLRAQANRWRQQGWSYRRIAGELQRLHHLNARLAFRLAHGWTQEEAARRWNERWSGEGPPKSGKSFSYWETWPARGGRAPSPGTLQRLAELYLCRPGDLLDGEDFGARDTGSDAVGPVGVGSGAAGSATAGSATAGSAVAVSGGPVSGGPVADEPVVEVAVGGKLFVITREDARRAYRRLVAPGLADHPAA
jgi:hypothetical protein